MTTITILGNGESRQQIDPSKLTGPTIGCNAIVRDLAVDHLICVDRKMVAEALSFRHPCIYTRADWSSSFKGVKTVPNLPYFGTERYDDPFHWGSGPYAVLLGCILAGTVHLVGFDLYSTTKHINNAYKGTKNYNKEDHRAIDPRYWIAQLERLFVHYRNHTFVIHQPLEWNLPDSWRKPNVSIDNSLFIKYNKSIKET
jgi:hypothetical protein